MESEAIFIGLDIHKATIAVAVAPSGRSSEVRFQGSLPHRPDAMTKFARRLITKHPGSRLSFCYEADARHDRLVKRIEVVVPTWSLAPLVMALQALWGIALITAATIVAEIGDLGRFDTPHPAQEYQYEP